MDLSDIRKRKKEVEQQILDLIRRFVVDTDLKVHDIDLEYDICSGSKISEIVVYTGISLEIDFDQPLE